MVRIKLRPNLGMQAQLYFLDQDPGVELLTNAMREYHWKSNPTGELSDRPALAGADECFTEDTEVLTKTGWVSLPNVTTEDQVLAISSTNEGFWEKPSRVIAQDYSGDVYDLNHRELSFTATEHHKHAVVPYRSGRITKDIKNLLKKEVCELPYETFMAVNTTFPPERPHPASSFRSMVNGILVSQRCF